MTDTTALDATIGRKIRLRRTMLGLTVDEVGAFIGVGGQQVYKYELGTSALSAAALFGLAQGLKVPVAYFFEELGDSQLIEIAMPEPDIDRGAMQLLRSYQSLANDARRRLRDLARLLSEENPQ